MTTEEKLEHFQSFCVEDARNRSAKMLDEYMSALEQTFAEHQEDAKRHAQMQLQSETEKIEREINKKLSIEQINIKRTLGHKNDELKDKLLVEVKDMLERFMDTPDYQKLLEAQVAYAKKVAGDEELVIYMDPVDEDKVRRISFHQNMNIKVSEYSFMGGTRAVIPSKNILIDNSFQAKLEEVKQNFKFDFGGKIHG
ncbi:MAG: V-type ATP synthase subunit E [Clostridiaceae bacterium]|nr:V-type ATP synthase subunit E [Clostridiaceae bacterium]